MLMRTILFTRAFDDAGHTVIPLRTSLKVPPAPWSLRLWRTKRQQGCALIGDSWPCKWYFTYLAFRSMRWVCMVARLVCPFSHSSKTSHGYVYDGFLSPCWPGACTHCRCYATHGVGVGWLDVNIHDACTYCRCYATHGVGVGWGDVNIRDTCTHGRCYALMLTGCHGKDQTSWLPCCRSSHAHGGLRSSAVVSPRTIFYLLFLLSSMTTYDDIYK